MLGADGLNLALMVADSGIIDSAVNDLMGSLSSHDDGRKPRCKIVGEKPFVKMARQRKETHHQSM